jgi:hypothetical protein
MEAKVAEVTKLTGLEIWQRFQPELDQIKQEVERDPDGAWEKLNPWLESDDLRKRGESSFLIAGVFRDHWGLPEESEIFYEAAYEAFVEMNRYDRAAKTDTQLISLYENELGQPDKAAEIELRSRLDRHWKMTVVEPERYYYF